MKENQKDYYEKNQTKMKEYRKDYYKKNLNEIKKSQKEYKMKHLNEIKKSQNEYKKRHLDKMKDDNREYYQKNQIKRKENNKDYYKKNLNGFKEYYKKNLDEIKENGKEYYKKNLDEIKAYKKVYYRKIRNQKNPNSTPNYSWKSRKESRINFESVVSTFHINELSDWYRISIDQIKQSEVKSLLVKFGTLSNALVYAYPEYPWDLSKFTFRGKKSTQRWLYFKLKELLPNVDIIEDYCHPDLVWEKINHSVQLDIWIPEYNLALEYQGEHHYYDVHKAYGLGSTSNMFIERDQEKKKMCSEKGVFLVCIPYWWDRKVSSLCSTLNQTHPIFPKTDSPPIPISPPNPTTPNDNQ